MNIKTKITIISGVVIALLISGYTLYQSQYGVLALAKEAVKNSLKDGESAKFRGIRQIGVTICGEVNAKNAFGAYVGFRPFVVADPQHENTIVNISDTEASIVGVCAVPGENTFHAEKSIPSKFVEIGAFTERLKDGKSLQVSISLKIPDEAAFEEECKKKTFDIQDGIKTILQSTQIADIASDEGKNNLANEIKAQLQKILNNKNILAVIFTSFEIK